MLLETEHISKQFSGFYALKDINFQLEAGEIHGLVGENGAGKSTLIKLLTGVYSLDVGRVLWNGQEVHIHTPVESRAVGINVIHQDRVLVPTFTAVENAYLGLTYPTKAGRIDWAAMEKRLMETAAELNIDIDPKQTAAEMSPPQRTCLEIVRSMMHDCKLLILDEPTASLTDKESELLFSIIGRLKAKGTSILYVTHRMDEIFRLTDRITVFKNGTMVNTLNTAETNKEQLIGKMTDQWVGEAVDRAETIGECLLKVEHVASRDGVVKDVSLEAHAGEILGVFGLGGSGRTETLECVYGYRALSGGSVTLCGEPYHNPSPKRSLARGMTLISEDRRGKAMIGSLSIKDNILLSCINDYAKFGVLDEKRETQSVNGMVEALSIRLASTQQRAIELSGGNQQKVVFAKTLITNPKVLLCDEPTQAVDVKTRSEIHRLLRQKAKEGSAVVFVSSDLKEVLDVADNILIIAGGRSKELMPNVNLSSPQVLASCYDH